MWIKYVEFLEKKTEGFVATVRLLVFFLIIVKNIGGKKLWKDFTWNSNILYTFK